MVFIRADQHLARQIGPARDRQALDQQAGRHFVIGRQHQPGVQLLALQHVVLQHLGQALQRLSLVAMQRHHALVGLLAGQAVLRVERDRAAALAVQIEQRGQAGIGRHIAHHFGGGPKAQVGLGFGHRQPDRAVTVHLQDQRAVELQIGLHQHTGCGHFTQQGAHRRRKRMAAIAGAAAARQQLLPACIQAHQRATHWQALEQELVQAVHGRVAPQAMRLQRLAWRCCCAT